MERLPGYDLWKLSEPDEGEEELEGPFLKLYELMRHDDESIDEIDYKINALWDKTWGFPDQRKALNDFCIAICGSSLETILDRRG